MASSLALYCKEKSQSNPTRSSSALARDWTELNKNDKRKYQERASSEWGFDTSLLTTKKQRYSHYYRIKGAEPIAGPTEVPLILKCPSLTKKLDQVRSQLLKHISQITSAIPLNDPYILTFMSSNDINDLNATRDTRKQGLIHLVSISNEKEDGGDSC